MGIFYNNNNGLSLQTSISHKEVFKESEDDESGEVSRKVRKKRWRWFGRVVQEVGKRLALEVQGMRKRGRPKQRWMEKIKEDMKEKGIRREQTQDRAVRRRLVK